MENNIENRKKVGRGFLGLIVILVLIVIATTLLFAGDEDAEAKENVSTEVVSTSTKDVAALCDISATSIQKTSQLDKLKGKYVQWEGTVSNVDSYLMVNLCPLRPSESSQMNIEMKEGQQDKMLDLKAGDVVTFKAKFDIYASSGINASEGEVIEVKK